MDNKLTEMISSLSADDLNTCYEEILQWEQTGSLPSGIMRKIHQQTNLNTLGLINMEKTILREIARRHYGR